MTAPLETLTRPAFAVATVMVNEDTGRVFFGALVPYRSRRACEARADRLDRTGPYDGFEIFRREGDAWVRDVPKVERAPVDLDFPF